jgi:hypothetical protein
MKCEIDLEIHEGYEPTGEYRVPRDGELVLCRDNYRGPDKAESFREAVFRNAKYIILRRVEPPKPVLRAWRDRSEVPVEALSAWFRWLDDGEEWYKPTQWTTHRMTIYCKYGRAEFRFAEMFEAGVEYSPDGKTWHKCGVEE